VSSAVTLPDLVFRGHACCCVRHGAGAYAVVTHDGRTLGAQSSGARHATDHALSTIRDLRVKSPYPPKPRSPDSSRTVRYSH
jgi:hypothetical protein